MRWPNEVNMTWGLSKAHLQERKGLKLQVETKHFKYLNTDKYLL